MQQSTRYAEPLGQLLTVNEVQLSYKNLPVTYDYPKLSDADEVAALLRRLWQPDLEYRENFNILLLSPCLKPLSFRHVSSGDTTSTIVCPKEISRAALLTNSTSVVLAHNHPSGELQPSQADFVITRKVMAALALFGIAVADHIILTQNAFYSFQQKGHLEALKSTLL